MKKNLFVISNLLLAIGIAAFVYSCAKKTDTSALQGDVAADALIADAKRWHAKQTQSNSTSGANRTLSVNALKKTYILPPAWENTRSYNIFITG